MIMIIAIIYISFYLWYLINSWKSLSENPQPPEKSTSPFSPSPTPHKGQVPPF